MRCMSGVVALEQHLVQVHAVAHQGVEQGKHCGSSQQIPHAKCITMQCQTIWLITFLPAILAVEYQQVQQLASHIDICPDE